MPQNYSGSAFEFAAEFGLTYANALLDLEKFGGQIGALGGANRCAAWRDYRGTGTLRDCEKIIRPRQSRSQAPR